MGTGITGNYSRSLNQRLSSYTRSKSTLQASVDLWYYTCMTQQTLTYPQNPATLPIGNQLPLYAGDRLTRQEFERRYQAHPEIKKAELVEGIVYKRDLHHQSMRLLWSNSVKNLMKVF